MNEYINAALVITTEENYTELITDWLGISITFNVGNLLEKGKYIFGESV